MKTITYRIYFIDSKGNAIEEFTSDNEYKKIRMKQLEFAGYECGWEISNK